MLHDVILNAWEERKDNYIRIKIRMWDHRTCIVGLQNTVFVKGKVHSSLTEMRIVERIEGVEFISILLR